jgi:hypothetical protein
MSLKARWLASSVQCPTWNSPCLVASCVTICAGERSRSRTCLPIMPLSRAARGYERPTAASRRQARSATSGHRTMPVRRNPSRATSTMEGSRLLDMMDDLDFLENGPRTFKKLNNAVHERLHRE